MIASREYRTEYFGFVDDAFHRLYVVDQSVHVSCKSPSIDSGAFLFLLPLGTAEVDAGDANAVGGKTGCAGVRLDDISRSKKFIVFRIEKMVSRLVNHLPRLYRPANKSTQKAITNNDEVLQNFHEWIQP